MTDSLCVSIYLGLFLLVFQDEICLISLASFHLFLEVGLLISLTRVGNTDFTLTAADRKTVTVVVLHYSLVWMNVSSLL